MRAVYLDEGKVELRDVPEPSDQGKKVHVKSTGICGSDLHMLSLKFPGTFIAGHEAEIDESYSEMLFRLAKDGLEEPPPDTSFPRAF